MFPPADFAPRVANIVASLAREVRGFERAHEIDGGFVCPLPDAGGGEATRDFFDYAAAKIWFADGGGSAKAEEAFRCGFTYEDMRPDAGTFGVFSFHIGDPPVVKDNPDEFALEGVEPFFAIGGAAVSPGLLGDSLPQIEAALGVVELHAVCPAYTNICLMQAYELTAVGQLLAAQADPGTAALGNAAIDAGAQRLASWLPFTAAAGITEFDSPTYNQVDLEATEMGVRSALDPATEAAFHAAADDVWRSVGADAIPALGTLAGPYSRTYDFFKGEGELNRSLYLVDLASVAPGVDLSGIYLLRGLGDLTYAPPVDALCSATTWPRTVLSTFGPDGGAGGRTRQVWLTADVSLGATSADYGSSLSSDQDEMVVASLSAVPELIAVLPDYLDAPGSTVAAGDFDKVTHLLGRPVSVQDQGELLALFAVPARNPNYAGDAGVLPLVNLTTNLLFPDLGLTDAGLLLLDGLPLQLSSVPAVVDLTQAPTLTLQVGTGVVAVSVLAASGLECADGGGFFEGAPATGAVVRYLAEASGDGGLPVGRLAIDQLDPVPAETSGLRDCVARTALLWGAGPCLGAGCAAAFASQQKTLAMGAIQSWDGGTGDWRVSVPGAGSPTGLTVERLVGQSGAVGTVIEQSANGQALVFPPLSVNGVAVPLGQP